MKIFAFDDRLFFGALEMLNEFLPGVFPIDRFLYSSDSLRQFRSQFAIIIYLLVYFSLSLSLSIFRGNIFTCQVSFLALC